MARRVFAVPVLIALAILAGAVAVAWPHFWAWRHLAAARAAVERYHPDEARRQIDACLAVWPDSIEAHLIAARAERLAGDFPKAEDHLRECQRLQKTPSEATVQEWALYHAAAGDLDDVEGYLQETIRRDPGRAGPIREALAEGYLRVYRIRDALNLLQDWLAAEPDEVQALTLLGNLYWQVSAPGSAADQYRRVLELDPSRREARERLAVGLLEVGRYDEALKHLEALRQSDPDDADTQVRIARCQERLDRPEEARATLDAVLSKHPDHGPALRLRGQMLLQDGKPAEAEDWLRRAARAQPDSYEANWSLYECLQKQGKDEAAKAPLARAEALKARTERLNEIATREMSARPRDPALHCEIGKLLLQRGMKELGERWLLSALRLEPHYKPAHAALADYYREQGDAEKADLHRRAAE